jgi:2-polyprenyl-6-hydroxyphenyl methylase / 3-demethylubiquinone-9 3-methyltransferase
MNTANLQEIAKFSEHASTWWDLQGPLRTLHTINPIRLEFIKQHVDLSKARVLDLGCGGGILTESLANMSPDVTGIDASLDAIKAAIAHRGNLAINYAATLVEDFKAASFDVITCLELLEHVDNVELIIANIARLLVPGGICFLSTINKTLQAYLEVVVAGEYILKLLPKQTHDFAKFIKPDTIAAYLRQYNLKITEIKGLKYNPLHHQAHLSQNINTNYILAAVKDL